MAMLVTQALAPGAYAGPRILAPAAPGLTTPMPAKAQVPAPAPSSPLLRGTSFGDWFRTEGLHYKGLLVARKPWWKDCQEAVDQGCRKGDFSEEEENSQKVFRGPEGLGDLGKVADKLLEKMTILPDDVREAVRGDICELGSVVGQLCPWSQRFDFKLEIIGQSCCPRWHQDNYCARAIISYNSAGTLYTPDDNVDFWELEHCGVNEHIIKDPSRVCALNVGEALFIKGTSFPVGAKGLVHKSPPVLYHDNGSVVNRLVLKVDVPEPSG